MSKKKKIIIIFAIYFIAQLVTAIFVDMGDMPKVGEFQTKTFIYQLPILGNTYHITTIVVTWILMVLFIWLALTVRKRLKQIPGRLQCLIELIVGFFDDLCNSSLGKDIGRRYFPLTITLFLFFLATNIIGIIPPFWKIIQGVNPLPAWFAFDCPSSDINTTLGLGLLVFVVVHYSGIKIKSFKTYVNDYFEPMVEIGKIKIPNLFMFPLNLVGEVGKVVSHSFRIFGNIMGGAIIILVVSYLVKYVSLPIILNFFFGIFQGVIQAFVFAMLALTYVAVMISTE